MLLTEYDDDLSAWGVVRMGPRRHDRASGLPAEAKPGADRQRRADGGAGARRAKAIRRQANGRASIEERGEHSSILSEIASLPPVLGALFPDPFEPLLNHSGI